MMRPPPTSISLSEADVDFHTKQLDLYLSLLKQGFRKDEIISYIKEHNQQSAHSQDNDLVAPSTVELAARNVRSSVVHVSPPTSDKTDSAEQGDDCAVAEGKLPSSPPLATSSPTELPPLGPARHVPRQSSLLRFAQAASPPAVPSDYPGLPARSYRPRTDTYSYNQSEVSTSDALSGYSNEQQPTEASSAGNDAIEAAGGNTDQGSTDETDIIRPDTFHNHSHGRAAADFEIWEDSDADSIPSHSPPSYFDNGTALRPLYPTTPSRSRQNSRDFQRPETEPRAQQLDGSFAVYNDALPAIGQPQTPLDVDRRPLLTIRDAAYTAPPGVLLSPFRGRTRDGSGQDNEPGTQTPTARAITMRERRAREMLRSLHTETARLERLRLHNAGDASHDEEVPGWRDGFEGDRVGEENWEIETRADSSLERGMRVISGNAGRG